MEEENNLNQNVEHISQNFNGFTEINNIGGVAENLPKYNAPKISNYEATNNNIVQNSENTSKITLEDINRQISAEGTIPTKIDAIPLSSFSTDPKYEYGTRPGDNWEEKYAQNKPSTALYVVGGIFLGLIISQIIKKLNV